MTLPCLKKRTLFFILSYLTLFSSSVRAEISLFSFLPNDSMFGKQWGLYNIGQPNDWGIPGLKSVDINILPAWDYMQNKNPSEVIVAIIDSGVDYNHPDLKENMWVNKAEFEGKPHVDDDGNGYVDDIYGYDFFNSDGDPLDDNGHGTHSAGIIGASGNNGEGIVGINKKVKIMALKFADEKVKGRTEAAIKAIKYATKMGAKIINLSWGYQLFEKNLYDAIKEAGEKNILFVAAAGNNARNNDLTEVKPTFPASYDISQIISVTAFNQKAELPVFSTGLTNQVSGGAYGEKNVHITAPGHNILSTWLKSTYQNKSGTSVAAPFVSGVASLVWSLEPNLSAIEVKERIIKTASPMFRFANIVSSHGRVDAYNALTQKVTEIDVDNPDNWIHNLKQISTEHPYKNSEKKVWEIEIPGASAISFYFDKIQMDDEFDQIDIHDRKGRLIVRIHGKQESGWSRIVVGDYAKLVFTSDQGSVSYGFDISKIAYK